MLLRRDKKRHFDIPVGCNTKTPFESVNSRVTTEGVTFIDFGVSEGASLISRFLHKRVPLGCSS